MYIDLSRSSATPFATSSDFPGSAPMGYLVLAQDTSIQYVWTGSSWNAVGGGSGTITSIGNFNGTSTAKGLSVTGNALSLHAADGTNPGAVSTGAQTFAGVKTFSSAPIFSSVSASEVLLVDGSKALTSVGTSGTGNLARVTSPVFTTPNIGTPSAGVLTSCTDLPVSTGISGLGSNVATFLATPSSANLASAVTDETGSGALVFATSPTLVTPVIGVASGTSLTVSGHVDTPSVKSSVVTLTDGATITPDFLAGSNFKVQLGGNRTLGVPSNLAAGQSGNINVFQDSTGSRTLSYAWAYIFPFGVAPTLSTGKFVMDQLTYLVNGYSTSTVTMTIATPCVVTWTSHGFVSGQRIQLTTTGALPTGLSTSTTYWVNVVDSNTFNLSSSLANLQAGTYIATTGSQSGTHTATAASITISANLGIA